MAHPTLVIGRTYFVDNPGAKAYVGELDCVVDPFTVALKNASWVANTGRFHQFLRDGTAEGMEIEPAGYVPCVRYQSINEWNHPLPTEPV